jgi:hypothetical protein
LKTRHLRTRTLLVPALAIVMLAISASTTSAARSNPRSSPQTVTVVLFDLSRSTNNPSIREQYLQGFATILAAVAARGGVVYGDVIDNAPLAHSTLPIRAELPRYRFPGNRLQWQHKLQASILAALETASNLLSQKPTAPGTAILDAISLSQRVFDRARSTRSKYLVAFTDGIEESSRYRFTKASLSLDAVDRFISKERSTNRLPHLPGVKAYVVGAGATAGTTQPSARILQVRSFWLTYLRACGTTVSPSDYGPTLVTFP